MARITDSERGARMALDFSRERAAQPDLFRDAPDVDFWQAIEHAACLELSDLRAMREAVRS